MRIAIWINWEVKQKSKRDQKYIFQSIQDLVVIIFLNQYKDRMLQILSNRLRIIDYP